MPNLYRSPAGSLIETSLSTESESPNLFIINQSCVQYTTAGSLIQSSLLADPCVQMKFFVREILDATPRSRWRVKVEAEGRQGGTTLTRRPATYNRTSDSRARPHATAP